MAKGKVRQRLVPVADRGWRVVVAYLKDDENTGEKRRLYRETRPLVGWVEVSSASRFEVLPAWLESLEASRRDNADLGWNNAVVVRASVLEQMAGWAFSTDGLAVVLGPGEEEPSDDQLRVGCDLREQERARSEREADLERRVLRAIRALPYAKAFSAEELCAMFPGNSVGEVRGALSGLALQKKIGAHWHPRRIRVERAWNKRRP